MKRAGRAMAFALLWRRARRANSTSQQSAARTPEKALEIVNVFLTTPFEGQRHEERVHLIEVNNYNRHKKHEEFGKPR